MTEDKRRWYLSFYREAFARAVAAYEVPDNVLICTSNETTSATVGEIVVMTWLSL